MKKTNDMNEHHLNKYTFTKQNVKNLITIIYINIFLHNLLYGAMAVEKQEVGKCF